MKSTWVLAAALLAGSFAGVAPADGTAATAEHEKWGEHMGDLPFIVGYDKGMKEVEYTGKPPMYFFTATW